MNNSPLWKQKKQLRFQKNNDDWCGKLPLVHSGMKKASQLKFMHFDGLELFTDASILGHYLKSPHYWFHLLRHCAIAKLMSYTASLDLVLLHATKTAAMQMQIISNIRFQFNLEPVNRIVLCLCCMEFLAWQKSRLQCTYAQKSLTEALQSWSKEWLLTAAACVLGHCTQAIYRVWTKGSLLPVSSHSEQRSSKIYLHPWVKRL